MDLLDFARAHQTGGGGTSLEIIPMFPKLALPKLEVQWRKGGSAAGRRSVMSIDGFTLPSPLKKNTGSFILI